MPRQKNTKPTHIYWIQDIRPETIAAGWVQGLPFYAGKTVELPRVRLAGHRGDAKRNPNHPTAKRLAECGEHVRIVTLEIVQGDGDWRERERHWIAFSKRIVFPEVMTNLSDGGEGPAGWVPSEEQRANMSAALVARWESPSERAKMITPRIGKKRPPEYCARMSAVRTGEKRTLESRFKISSSKKGKKLSSEHIAKLTGRNLSPEHRAAISAAQKGKRPSAETRAKLSAWQMGRKLSSEHIANLSAAKTGHKHTPEARAKMIGRIPTAEARANMSAAGIATWAKKRNLA